MISIIIQFISNTI